MKTTTILTALLLFFLFLTIGCGSDEAESPELSEIMIQSSNGDLLDLANQDQTVLTASGVDQFNDPIEITSTINWSADNNNITIDQNGTVSTQAVGSSVVTAESEGVEATFAISVWDSSAPRTEIYVSDVGINRNGPHLIIKYDESGDHSEIFINNGLSKPQDIVFLEDQGIVLVSNLSTNDINKFDIETGNLVSSFATGLSGPTRIDIGPDDLLYAIPWNGGSVKRYQLDGTFVDDFTTTSVNQAIGIAWDTDENMYVASFNDGSNGFVRKFDTAGNDLGLFINANLSGPTDIWFDDSGNLFVNDWSGNSVKKFDSNGTFLEIFISNVSQPEGVAIMDDGSILIGASGTSSVKMYSSSGSPIKDLVKSGDGGLQTPNAVVLRKVNH